MKGFPVVSADGKRILLGFIDRTDLRYVFGACNRLCKTPLTLTSLAEKARKMQDIHPYTPVSFEADDEDREEVEMGGVTAGPAVGVDEDISTEIMETTATPDILKLWPWVNQVCQAPHFACTFSLTPPR